MTPTRRWCCVALAVLLLIGVPLAVEKARPASAAPISAANLLARTQTSGPVAYSGYVQSLGTLGLPLSDQFTDLADLFGQRTTMRVWWRSGTDWRVDDLNPTGETDLFHDARGTTSWDFESNRATRTGPALIRLPQTSDLLPPALAHQVLENAGPREVTRLDPVRVAGISAPGLRLTPRDPQTSISHVDIWVEPRTGLPLKVAIYGPAKQAAITSQFSSVSLSRPTASKTRFSLAPGARSRFENVVDIAAAANAYAPVAAPATLTGLTRRGENTGAVGVYGRGVTRLIAIPLQDRVATPLRLQLGLTPGSTQSDSGIALGVGPLNVLLTANAFAGHSYLLAGTVTPQTLDAAARDIASNPLIPNSLRPRNP